jgi:hypothetical protein
VFLVPLLRRLLFHLDVIRLRFVTVIDRQSDKRTRARFPMAGARLVDVREVL